MVASDGGIFDYGSTPFFGSRGGSPLNQSIVGMAESSDGNGYWLVASDGGIFGYGDAGFYGSHGGSPLNRPIVGMASTPDGGGYWLVASDGGIFGYGDAGFYGSHGGSPLNRPIVGMASTPDGGGYWLVASDGGIFGYGDATFHGSHGGSPLNQPIVGMASTPDGGGYWLVASDGGIFGYGDAGFYGSHRGAPLNQPIVGMASTRSGTGYWLVASDGGIFSYGDAGSHFYGSLGGSPLNRPVVGMSALPAGHGYWSTQDNCYYYLQGNQWYSNFCVRYATYTDGSVDTNLWNFYSYPGYGQVPSVLDFQVDLSDPAYFAFRVEELPQIFSYIGEIRIPYDGSTPPQYLVCSQPPLYGTCYWFTLDQIEAALGVGGSSTVPASLANLPPSSAVESTVQGVDTSIETLNQSIADSDGLPNDGESGDYDAFGPRRHGSGPGVLRQARSRSAACERQHRGESRPGAAEQIGPAREEGCNYRTTAA